MNILDIQPYLQLVLNFGAICVMLYTLKKFLGTPHSTLEQRITAIEVRQNEMDRSLKEGNDNFRHQKEFNEDMQTCILALVDFELAYCSTTDYHGDVSDLQEAKKILRSRKAKT